MFAITSKPPMRASVATRATKKHKVNAFLSDLVEKRKEMDKKRLDRIKEIGKTLDHIAKDEAKHTVETIKTVLPLHKYMKKDGDASSDDASAE